MTTRLETTCLAVSLASVCSVCLSWSQQDGASDVPLAFPVQSAKVRIVDATFVTKLEGVTNRFEESDEAASRCIRR